MAMISLHDVKKVSVSRFYHMKEATSPTWVLSLDVEDANDWHTITLFLDSPDALGELADSLAILQDTRMTK